MGIMRLDVSRSDLELPFFPLDYVYSFVLYKERSHPIAHTALLVDSIAVTMCTHMCTFLRALSFLCRWARPHMRGAVHITATEQLLFSASVFVRSRW